jgi:predicted phosphodiesterase
MKTFVIGDLHGGMDGSMKYLNTKKWSEQKNLTKSDVLIQLGDFGYIWYDKSNKNYKEDKHYQEWFASRNYTTIIVPGNHDNWDIIENLDIIEKYNGKMRVLNTKKGNLYIAITGEVYTINNKKILTICGADSIDKSNRTVGIDWWEQESITNKDIDNTLENLKKSENETIDYICSHTMPESMIEQFIYRNTQNSARFNDGTAKFLEHIWTNHDIKYGVHCGHFHMNYKHYRKTPHYNEYGKIVWSQDVDNNYVHCHYKDIPHELDDVL